MTTSSTIGQSATPLAIDSPPSVTWQIALDGLSPTDPALSAPITWHGGFAVLEQGAQTTSALWTSADGRQWVSQPLPFAPHGYVDDLVAYGDGLALANVFGSPTVIHFQLWTSANGRAWQQFGDVDVTHRASDQQITASLVGWGTHLAVLASIHRGLCCGDLFPSDDLLAAAPAGPLADKSASLPATDSNVGVFAWTSQDGSSWQKHRLQPFGMDSLTVIGTVNGNLLGLREGAPLRLVTSADAVHWETVAVLPDDVDPTSRLAIQSSPDGFIVAADTAEARHLNGTNLTIWTGTRDGTWTDVLERPGWNVTSLAVDGDAAILGAQGAGSSFLVSRDTGSSWQASGGWPDITLSCDESVALAATTAISAVNCQGGRPPRVFSADLGDR